MPYRLAAGLLLAASSTAAAQVRALDQGSAWTQAARAGFYQQDQGSRLIPLGWLRALRQSDGTAFLLDGLARYGYLPGGGGAPDLPIGFTAGSWRGAWYAGMTCSACHTRQIRVGGAEYRIDGGPALADFQRLLADLDRDVGATLADPARFSAFAAAVLGRTPDAPASTALHARLAAWYAPFHTLMSRALPDPPWGPGRLDAVGMIFDRVTGLDIGRGTDPTLPQNIRPAAAPVRYPFLWNATRQDHTQWPGFAGNGTPILGSARNLGEVYGVFAIFHPRPFAAWSGTDFRDENSADFPGLDAQEKAIARIGPPAWPFALDEARAARGRALYEAAGRCASCHGIATNAHLPLQPATWKTPLIDTGTDSREYAVLGWTAETGVLAGSRIPFLTQPLGARAASKDILKEAVIGSLVEHVDPLATGATGVQADAIATALVPVPAQPGSPYEARVLQGVWAAAPYLHDGAVPTLADLLTPPDQRPASFAIGPAYDIARIGLAVAQPPGSAVLHTTGCEDRSSGRSRCGHDFGTRLTAEQKADLLEYLKTL